MHLRTTSRQLRGARCSARSVPISTQRDTEPATAVVTSAGTSATTAERSMGVGDARGRTACTGTGTAASATTRAARNGRTTPGARVKRTAMGMAGAAAKAAGRVEAQCATAIPNRTSGTMTPRALLLGESRSLPNVCACASGCVSTGNIFAAAGRARWSAWSRGVARLPKTDAYTTALHHPGVADLHRPRRACPRAKRADGMGRIGTGVAHDARPRPRSAGADQVAVPRRRQPPSRGCAVAICCARGWDSA